MGIEICVLRYERGYADKCELIHVKIFYATNLLKNFVQHISVGLWSLMKGLLVERIITHPWSRVPSSWCSTRDHSLTSRQSSLNIPLVIGIDNPISEDLYPRKIVDVTQVCIVTY